jgi:CubicO group peptidase (beta-lactamase class C family)
MMHPDPADPSRRGFLVTASAALVAGALPMVPEDARAMRAATPTRDVVPADVERWMRLANVPGLAMATVQGSRVESRAWGVRRARDASASATTTTSANAPAGATAAAPASVNGDTVFEAASLTKQLFAYHVHRLAMDGVLDLDRPVREYLALPDAGDARASGITARHLLGHAGGWRNWRFGPQQKLTADFDPGSRWSYSGEGYFFLQRVLEARTGQPVARLLRERVLAPLGMRRSALLWTPALDTHLASPHSNRGVPIDSFHVQRARAMRAALEKAGAPTDEWSTADAERTWPTLEGVDNVLPNNLLPNVAASLFTTANDYGAFLAHLLGDPAGQAMLERMLAPVATMSEALAWGAGVGLEREEGRTTFWQWGDNSGFKHFLLGDAEARTAWVVFTNGNGGRNVYERVLRAATGRDHAAFLWL